MGSSAFHHYCFSRNRRMSILKPRSLLVLGGELDGQQTPSELWPIRQYVATSASPLVKGREKDMISNGPLLPESLEKLR